MLLAAGNINDPYEVIGILHTTIAKQAVKSGCSGNTLPVEQAYREATQALSKLGATAGASGVIHIGYDYRISTTRTGCSSDTTANFELYAWGTAIRLK